MGVYVRGEGAILFWMTRPQASTRLVPTLKWVSVRQADGATNLNPI